MRAEFAVYDGLLLKGTSLVIPAVLQRDILNRLHEAYQAIVKCRERARNTVWWLGINKQLDEVVRNCRTCAESRSDKAEPMMCSEFPNRPWEKVASDLFEHNKQSYLLVVDYYSRYIEIARLHRTSSNAVIDTEFHKLSYLITDHSTVEMRSVSLPKAMDLSILRVTQDTRKVTD